LSLEDINDLLDGICAISNKRSIFYLWRPIASDPDDDFLVDLAVEVQADFIITYTTQVKTSLTPSGTQSGEQVRVEAIEQRLAA
jgi:predicted nucleic acid-binding protein